jgi:hypothetical protein
MTLRGRTYEDAGKRVRTALVVLIGGVVLLLAALGMALLRVPSSEQQVVQVDRGESAPTDEGLAARTGVVLIAVGGVLLVTLLVACYALFRVTRRFAAAEQRRTFQPTATEDVWQMHKLPERPPGESQDHP